jgi:hypothetical protein
MSRQAKNRQQQLNDPGDRLCPTEADLVIAGAEAVTPVPA